MSPFRPSFPPAIRRVSERAVLPSLTTHYSLPTTHYPLPTTHFRARLSTGRGPRVTSHAFSCACRLFVAPKKVNSFAIKQIQPLFAKHPGWGCPSAISVLRSQCTLCWAFPHLKLATRHSPLATRHFSFIFSNLPPLVLSCLSFLHSFSLFSTTSSLFLQNGGGGGYRIASRMPTRGGYGVTSDS